MGWSPREDSWMIGSRGRHQSLIEMEDALIKLLVTTSQHTSMDVINLLGLQLVRYSH